MIDRDGIERPDQFDAHMLPLANSKKIQLATDYKYFSTNIFYRIWKGFLKILAKIFLNLIAYIGYGLKVYGRKNLKAIKKQGAIAVLNHVHVFDVSVACVNVFINRTAYFTSIKEDFEIPYIRHFLRILGGLPIPRDTKRMRDFTAAVEEVINKKQVVIFCPEGSMWPNYRDVRPFKNGAFKFASKLNVPIIPIVITFEKKKKMFSKNKYKYKMRFNIEEPVFPNPDLEGFNQQEYLKTSTEKVFKNVIDEAYKNETEGKN